MRVRRSAAWSTSVLIVGCAVLAACSSGGSRGGGSAVCPAKVLYGGHTYWGVGELKRDPATTGRRVKAVLPSCDDSGGQEPADPDTRVDVDVLADVPAETAVLWNGSVYLRDGRELPAPARLWFRAPRCTTDGQFDLIGDWLGVIGPKPPRSDGDLRPPYRLEVHVTSGPDAYAGTTIQVHADAATDPRLGPNDVKTSLWNGGQVAARVDCVGGRFHAVSLRVP
jgi:hypothetical protein